MERRNKKNASGMSRQAEKGRTNTSGVQNHLAFACSATFAVKVSTARVAFVGMRMYAYAYKCLANTANLI